MNPSDILFGWLFFSLYRLWSPIIATVGFSTPLTLIIIASHNTTLWSGMFPCRNIYSRMVGILRYLLLDSPVAKGVQILPFGFPEEMVILDRLVSVGQESKQVVCHYC